MRNAITVTTMLYTSVMRPYGPGILSSYAQEAETIAIGSTGGGVDVGVLDQSPLEWEELVRDLRLAWFWCNDIYVFSLEGCVQQNYLTRLKGFKWDYPIIIPEEQILYDTIKESKGKLTLNSFLLKILLNWLFDATGEGQFLLGEDISIINKIIIVNFHWNLFFYRNNNTFSN